MMQPYKFLTNFKLNQGRARRSCNESMHLSTLISKTPVSKYSTNKPVSPRFPQFFPDSGCIMSFQFAPVPTLCM